MFVLYIIFSRILVHNLLISLELDITEITDCSIAQHNTSVTVAARKIKIRTEQRAGSKCEEDC